MNVFLLKVAAIAAVVASVSPCGQGLRLDLEQSAARRAPGLRP
ncbi:MAG: hypothetical protein ACXIVD_07250 [Salinarimonas sp.]